MQRALHLSFSGNNATFVTVQQLLNKLVDEQWCFYGQNYCGLDYSDWSLHLNLCCAWNSIDVPELILDTYKFVFKDELEKDYTFEQFSIAMRCFSTMEAVSNCVDLHMSKNVRKCRGAFTNSVYERKIKLMYCMVWFNVMNVENCTFDACEKFLVSKVFEKKFGELKFEELYNKFVDEVVENPDYVYKRKRKVWTKRKLEEVAESEDLAESEDSAESDGPPLTRRARVPSPVQSDALVSQHDNADLHPDKSGSQPDESGFKSDESGSQPDVSGFECKDFAVNMQNDDWVDSWLNPIGVTNSLQVDEVASYSCVDPTVVASSAHLDSYDC